MKTTKIIIEDYKDTSISEVIYDLFPSQSKDDNERLDNQIYKVFQYGEFLNMEVEVDENLNIVGGRIIPFKEDWKD